MTESDRGELGTLLSQVLGFYEKTVSPFALGVWWQACQPMEIDAVRRALTAHALDPDRGQYPPKPADLIRQMYGDANDQALIAWGQVISAARAGGARFEGAIQEAIDGMGGMGRIRMSNEAEHGFLQREFVAAYKAYRHRDQSAQMLGNSTNVRRIGGDI